MWREGAPPGPRYCGKRGPGAGVSSGLARALGPCVTRGLGSWLQTSGRGLAKLGPPGEGLLQGVWVCSCPGVVVGSC